MISVNFFVHTYTWISGNGRKIICSSFEIVFLYKQIALLWQRLVMSLVGKELFHLNNLQLYNIQNTIYQSKVDVNTKKTKGEIQISRR